MRAIFFLSIIAGAAAAAALAWFAPFLEQERTRAQTMVQTNGGRMEQFEIRLATDVLSSLPGIDRPDDGFVPASADWYPELAPFRGVAEMFRLRNAQGVAIGIASRVRGLTSTDDVEWILHLPARGTLALRGLSADVAEVGDIVTGTREFSALYGTWQARLDEDNVWRIESVVKARTDEVEGAVQ
ncbi:MAG: hypothetical protein AAFO81_04045 [Pseudomonadota bacterium]